MAVHFCSVIKYDADIAKDKRPAGLSACPNIVFVANIEVENIQSLSSAPISIGSPSGVPVP